MKKRLTFAVAVLLALGINAVRAEDSSGLSLNAGLTLTDGNSESLRANAGILWEGKKDAFGSVRVGAEGNYGESRVDGTKDTDIENARAFANARKTLSEMTFVALNTSAFYDRLALVDYRFIVGPGVGSVLFKNESTELSVEFGPAYLWEKVDDEREDFWVIRLAQRLDIQLSETARLWQQAEYLPKAGDIEDYLLNSEIGVEAAINTLVNLRLVLQSAYDSKPALDRERHDLTFIGGLSIKL